MENQSDTSDVEPVSLDDSCRPIVAFDDTSKETDLILLLLKLLYGVLVSYSLLVLKYYWQQRRVYPINKSLPLTTLSASLIALCHSAVLVVATDPSLGPQDSCTEHVASYALFMTFLFIIAARLFLFTLSYNKITSSQSIAVSSAPSTPPQLDLSPNGDTESNNGSEWMSEPPGFWREMTRNAFFLPLIFLLALSIQLFVLLYLDANDVCLCRGNNVLYLLGSTFSTHFFLLGYTFYKYRHMEMEFGYNTANIATMGGLFLVNILFLFGSSYEDDAEAARVMGLVANLALILHPFLYIYIFIYSAVIKSRYVEQDAAYFYGQFSDTNDSKPALEKKLFGFRNGSNSRLSSRKNEMDVTSFFDLINAPSAPLKGRSSNDSSWQLAVQTPEEVMKEADLNKPPAHETYVPPKKPTFFDKVFRLKRAQDVKPIVLQYDLSLVQVLHHDAGRKLFTRYCDTELSGENPRFYEQINNFARTFQDPNEMSLRETQRFKRLARKYYSMFISLNGNMPVNLPSHITEEFRDGGFSPTHQFDVAAIQNAFVLALNEIYTLMQRDSYVRFRQTDEFKEFAEELLASNNSQHLAFKR